MRLSPNPTSHGPLTTTTTTTTTTTPPVPLATTPPLPHKGPLPLLPPLLHQQTPLFVPSVGGPGGWGMGDGGCTSGPRPQDALQSTTHPHAAQSNINLQINTTSHHDIMNNTKTKRSKTCRRAVGSRPNSRPNGSQSIPRHPPSPQASRGGVLSARGTASTSDLHTAASTSASASASAFCSCHDRTTYHNRQTGCKLGPLCHSFSLVRFLTDSHCMVHYEHPYYSAESTQPDFPSNERSPSGLSSSASVVEAVQTVRLALSVLWH